jgi:hypothetical protein
LLWAFTAENKKKPFTNHEIPKPETSFFKLETIQDLMEQCINRRFFKTGFQAAN